MYNCGVMLWILFGVSAAIYWWVGKVYVSQPKFNHPSIFWNPTRAKILLVSPPIGFLLTIVGGFIYTENGWWYLGVVVIGLVALSSRPLSF